LISPSIYREQGGYHLIELTLREPLQLFHALDPAPFHDKDLEASAEGYIVDAMQEIGAAHPAKLVIHLPESALAGNEARHMPSAIHNYFAYRARQTRSDLRELLRTGFISLLIGLAFLFSCLYARDLAASTNSEWRGMFGEGMLIIGWVAMWRPVDVFLYAWWPLRQRQSMFQRLAVVPVELRAVA
jgi:hypothetical protein